MKTPSSTWLVTYDFDSEKSKQSETLYTLPQFIRVCQVNITDGFMSYSCKFRSKFVIDCPHVYQVVSQSQQFKETNHHHISIRWWNFLNQFACMSKNDNQFEAVEETMKILQIDEKDGLAVEVKWFNHLPIHDKKDIPTAFVTYNQQQCINYPFLKVELKELD